MNATQKNPPALYRANQRGVTLVVVLIMLMIVTLLGLVGVRSSTQQERMVAGFYDRSLAMQSAEATMREAFRRLLVEIEESTNAITIVDCVDEPGKPTKPGCEAVPDSTFKNNLDGKWNNFVGHLPNQQYVAGTPQFYIQRLGEDHSASGGGGLSGSNDASDDAGPSSSNISKGGGGGMAYRIIVRSADPTDKNVNGRSLVVLSGITR